MLPLCTSVTLFRLFTRAYLIARRTSRFVPVGEIVLIPTPDSQRICFFPSFNFSFFFFQAEDGIRDYKVTGVPCALPIFLLRDHRLLSLGGAYAEPRAAEPRSSSAG